MKIKKADEDAICLECGRKQHELNKIYEVDFGTTNIWAANLCKRCMNRLWCNIDILLETVEE